MEDFAKKLKMFRKGTGLSQQEFAEKIGIPQSSWSSYERGRTTITAGLLVQLEKMGFTNIAKEMFGNDAQLNLSQEDIDNRHKFAKNFSQDTPIDALPKQINNNGFAIPLLDQKLSAGKGSPLPEDDTAKAYVEAPTYLQHYGKDLAALTVDGDSMEPTLSRGDMVVCDSCGWNGEGIYAIQMNGSGYVKRLSQKPGKVVVMSDNPRYETWEESLESENIRIIGRVHCALKVVE